MKHNTTILVAALAFCLTATAQRTPDHNFDFEKVTGTEKDSTLNWDDFYKFFDSWQPGTPPSGISKLDDEFFISRQRPLPRIADGDYQVRSDVPAGRKMLLWTPLDDPTATWKALPRYCFEGDNFSMWQYINCHGNWSAPWIRVSAGISDAAAKNGVTVGCVLSIPWNAKVSLNGTTSYCKTLAKLLEKNDDGTFKNSLKLAKLMKYYGINGLGVNSEFNSTKEMMTLMQDFFVDLHKKAESIGWKFELQWYDLTKDNGMIMGDYGLCKFNRKMFGTGDHIVTDQMFANYNWDNYLLEASVKCAKSLNRDPYDYYAGFDIQGRALKQDYWQSLIDNEISVGFWGAHAQSLIHQSATDDGTSDKAIQKAYLRKQELIFSGGNRNPALLPKVRVDCSLANADLTTFHGLARLLTAKSTIQSVPFVTRFNLGNGLKLYKDGLIASDSKWYNLNTQDYLPTWRFWITDANDQVTSNNLSSLAKAELTWDDAYTGGSCLRLYGATDFSRIKLFKTKLDAEPTYELSLTYKIKNSTESHAKLFVATSDDLTKYKETGIPDTEKEEEWTTFKVPLSKLGIKSGDKIAMIGISLNGTSEDYQMLVGELALRNPAQSFATITPSIKEINVLRGYYDRVDFKMRYASKEESGEEKTYNDEVGTWYYEIYFQQKGEEPKLMTTTESWAAYVIGAPLNSGAERMCRFGVRAVAPDGEQGSPIAWSDYQEITYTTQNTTLLIDHSIIKPNETFKIYYEDTLMPAAKEWKIINSTNGNTVAQAFDATSISTAIDTEGLYDLIVTKADNSENVYRGFICITPNKTGAMPEIYNISASAANVKAGENVTLSYTSRNADGKVSRALTINDPDMLSIPAATLTGKAYSIALWFKANGWAHNTDGTNLITKNTIADAWPYNNWGDLWVQVKPECKDSKTGKVHPANEISFNTLGWSADGPNFDMISDGYSILPNTWYHLIITQDAKNIQKMYLNGKRVAGPAIVDSSKRREDMAKSDSRIDISAPANIHISGSGVYQAAFNGAIDEVQVWNKALSDEEALRSMKGYADNEIPDGLVAYYTFEDTDANGQFSNHGTLSGNAASVVKVVNSGGENTSNAEYLQQTADNSQPGYPGIAGTLDVKTQTDWNLGQEGDAKIVNEQGQAATITYVYGGKKDVSLTLSNIWGSNTMSKSAMIEVDGPALSVNKVTEDSFAMYPNPFADRVNFRFAKAGEYEVNILSEAGTLLQTSSVHADSGDVASVSINGKKGVYLIQVTRNGNVYKTIKAIKK